MTGTAAGSTATIPYWFAVPGTSPAGISILYQDASDQAFTTAVRAVIFRVVDAAGLPFAGPVTPTVRVTSVDGTAHAYRYGTVPGTFATDVRMGSGALHAPPFP